MTAPAYAIDKSKISNVREMYINKFIYRLMSALSFFVNAIHT